MSHSWKIHEGNLNFCGINWRAYPCNGSKTLVSQGPSGNSVIASRIFSYEKIVKYRFRSSLEQMWSKLCYCCKMSITIKIWNLWQLTDPPSGRWLQNIRHLGLMNTPSFLNSQNHFFSIGVGVIIICGPQHIDNLHKTTTIR